MEELLTVEEMAQKLKVSRATIYEWCSLRYIPYYKLRGANRFRWSQIEIWLKKNMYQGRSLYRLHIESTIANYMLK